MRVFPALLLACLLGLPGTALSADRLACRVLYRFACTPDQCLPIDSDLAGPVVQIVLSGKHLTYTEGGKSWAAVVRDRRLGKGYRIITGGPIDWPRYGAAEGDPGRGLGSVAIVVQPQGKELFFSWRVKYLGTSAEQESEDVLYGDCL